MQIRASDFSNPNLIFIPIMLPKFNLFLKSKINSDYMCETLIVEINWYNLELYFSLNPTKAADISY